MTKSLKSLAFTILFVVCAAPFIEMAVAQTSAQPQEMVQIPAGKFWMGRTQSTWRDPLDVVPRAKMDDRPANLIELDAFYIDKTEVTNAEYAKYVQAKSIRAPWHWPEGKVPQGKEKQAVSNVSWYEAADYCKWAGKRLPTEAEWEKAARGGLDRKPFPWGDYDDSVGGRGAPPMAALRLDAPVNVGSYKPNAYGLYDTIGNVMEWTNDWYELNYYAFMPKKNPQGPETGLYRSVRGAGWADRLGELSTTFYRNFSDPELRSYTIGFRCAK
jgi:formylglycine-generating enzyme required for sulfatase activity